MLRCGKASITLTKAGKVLIEGTYLLNRSSGVNRIKGGSAPISTDGIGPMNVGQKVRGQCGG